MIDYSPFWKTLEQSNLDPYQLQHRFKLSGSIIVRIKQEKNISVKNVNVLCKIMKCDVCDIIEYVDEGNSKCREKILP